MVLMVYLEVSMSVFFYGFATTLSLIVAIGAQNAFVLKQGLKKQYLFIICCVCAISDSLLIYMGVMGFSKVMDQFPYLVDVAKYFGALFLVFYGLKNFHSAWKGNGGLDPSQIEQDSLIKIVCLALAFTWLNPHTYLDTVVLIGSISVQFTHNKLDFALGAMAASWIFFFILAYGARFLLPFFQKAISWRILDVGIGIMMWGIAWSLLG